MKRRAVGRQEYERKLVRRKWVTRWTLLATATVLAFITITALVADRLFLPSAFRVDRVKVEGVLEHIDPTPLAKVVSAAVDGNFFSLDLNRVERAVADLPWVYSVTVRRVWPRSIHVTVIEQHPVARWGKSHWLNTDGQVITLTPASDLTELVQLDGPDGASFRVLERYRKWQTRLAKYGLKIRRVTLSPRRAWTLAISPMSWTVDRGDGIGAAEFDVILGNRDTEARLQRFVRSYGTLLYQQAGELDRVDMRYPNGIAVSRRVAPASDNNSEANNRA